MLVIIDHSELLITFSPFMVHVELRDTILRPARASHIQTSDICLAGVLRGAGRPHLAAGQAGRAGEELSPDCGAVASLLAVLVEGVVCRR